MYLIVDAGNTNIKFGYFKDDKLVTLISTRKEDLLKVKLPKNLKVEQAWIGSVIPSFNKKIAQLINKTYSLKSNNITNKMFLKHLDLSKFDLNEVGSDILALAFYVKSCFKKGIGLSLGTANFAVGVNDKKLLGAIITPGLDHMLNTLQSSTELVNKDNKVKQSNLFFDFGINTEQALDSGSSHMLLGFINSLINMSKSKHSLTSLCICGGNSVLIKKGLDKTKLKKITFNPNAVIEGYYLLVK